MAFNKMNVFHWHLTDHQSFPYQSRAFPELSNKSAYSPASVYTPEDVKEIVEFARQRGIRVIPEIDLPGHSRSFGYSHPELLTRCYEGGEPTNNFGPLDPTKDTTYAFLSVLFAEVVELFPDTYLHLGFDEVELHCWATNPDVITFMHENSLRTVASLLKYFANKLQNILVSVSKTSKTSGKINFIVWQEAYENNLNLKNDTIIQIWKDFYIYSEIYSKPTIFSKCWYLDMVESARDWITFYNCKELTDFLFSTSNNNLQGGEACMWTEYQYDDTILQRIWPLASLTAERLWSSKSVTNIYDAAHRLEEHRCRMLSRGVPVSVLTGPGYCSARSHFSHQLSHSSLRGDCSPVGKSSPLSIAFQFAFLLGLSIALILFMNRRKIGHRRKLTLLSIALISICSLLLLYPRL